MADKDKGGDKTELPTPKKLQDARKKGDIAKAKEITPTLGTIAALILFMVAGGYVANRVASFGDRVVGQATNADFAATLATLASEAITLLLTLCAIVLVPLATIGLLAEAFQTKGMFSAKKIEPKMENLNPVEGIKRLFGKQGLVELVKTLVKVIAIIVIVVMLSRSHIENMGAMLLPATEPVWREGAGMQAGLSDASRTFSITLQILAWVAAIFVGVAIIDNIWSKHDFTKKMMMSRRDIKDEVKRDEGDPHIKGERRQMAQEWAQSGAVSNTVDASALLVNPTHIAIALDYDAERAPVPVVLARGEGETAAAMREAALQAGVPIIRHVRTARAIWARGEIGEIVPEDMFDAIAEIILWARKARTGEAPMDCDLDRQERDRADQDRGFGHGGAARTASGPMPPVVSNLGTG